MSLFYYCLLAICVFIGSYAALTGHWIILGLCYLVTLYFIICPEDIEKARDGED